MGKLTALLVLVFSTGSLAVVFVFARMDRAQESVNFEVALPGINNSDKASAAHLKRPNVQVAKPDDKLDILPSTLKDSPSAGKPVETARQTEKPTPSVIVAKPQKSEGKIFRRPTYDNLRNFRILVLGAPARTKRFMAKFRAEMDSQQSDEARRLIESYNPKFDQLRRTRSSILENERESRMEELLLENQKKTVALSQEMFTRIRREILSPMPSQIDELRVSQRVELSPTATDDQLSR